MGVQIKCLDEYEWITPAYVPVLRQIELEGMKRFYFRSAVADGEAADRDDYTNLKYRNPKYLSILNHLRFYLPQIFPHLDKVLFLDDDGDPYTPPLAASLHFTSVTESGAVAVALFCCAQWWFRRICPSFGT